MGEERKVRDEMSQAPQEDWRNNMERIGKRAIDGRFEFQSGLNQSQWMHLVEFVQAYARRSMDGVTMAYQALTSTSSDFRDYVTRSEFDMAINMWQVFDILKTLPDAKAAGRRVSDNFMRKATAPQSTGDVIAQALNALGETPDIPDWKAGREQCIQALHDHFVGDGTVKDTLSEKISEARFQAMLQEAGLAQPSAGDRQYREAAQQHWEAGKQDVIARGGPQQVQMTQNLSGIKQIFTAHIARHSGFGGFFHSRAHHSGLVGECVPKLDALIARSDAASDAQSQLEILVEAKAAIHELLDKLPNDLASNHRLGAMHSNVTDLHGDLVQGALFALDKVNGQIAEVKQVLQAEVSEENVEQSQLGVSPASGRMS